MEKQLVAVGDEIVRLAQERLACDTADATEDLVKMLEFANEHIKTFINTVHGTNKADEESRVSVGYGMSKALSCRIVAQRVQTIGTLRSAVRSRNRDVAQEAGVRSPKPNGVDLVTLWKMLQEIWRACMTVSNLLAMAVGVAMYKCGSAYGS